MRFLPVIFLALTTACQITGAHGAADADVRPHVDMPLGVDDAGSLQQIWLDGKAERAFDEIGFDYLSHHVNGDPPVEEVKLLDRWAQERNCGYLLNQEGAIRSPGDPAVYTRPGTFFQPSEEYVKTCVSSPRFMGFTYDEVEHWINDQLVCHYDFDEPETRAAFAMGG